MEKILPFFHRYPVLGTKQKDFENWTKTAWMIKSNAHLTKEGLNKTSHIKKGMNKGRYLE